MTTDEQLRREIDQLGRMFGDVIRRFDGEAAFDLIEEVRRLARLLTSSDPVAAEQLSRLLQSLSLEELRIVVREYRSAQCTFTAGLSGSHHSPTASNAAQRSVVQCDATDPEWGGLFLFP